MSCGSLFICSCFLMYSLTRVNFQLPRTADGQVAGAHDPREWGYKAKCQHATSIPGYWPDESRQHGTSLNSLFFVNVSFIVLLIVPPGLLLIHHRVNKNLTQMCASKNWKEENLPQLEQEGNTAR